MEGIIFGIALMTIGALLLLVSRVRSKKNTVHADRGSIAIGGDNSGSVTNVNLNAKAESDSHGHWLTIVATLVELAGIGVTIWHAMHLAAK